MNEIMIALAVGLVGWSVVAGVRTTRRRAAVRALMQEIRRAGEPLIIVDSTSTRFQLVQVNTGRRSRWRFFVLAVSPARIELYPVGRARDQAITFSPEQVRWFGRPQKYHLGVNEIWLHVAAGEDWWLIRVRLWREQMRALVRALKQVAPAEQVTAYRRHRPYVHYGPVRAYPATQDMQGAWVLGAPCQLYLTPLVLVIFEQGVLRRVLALETVQRVAAIRRIDQPGAAGLVRFEVDGAPLAFATRRYAKLAEALAEAARRTLEDPVQWQRKKKKPEALDLDADQVE